MSTSVAQKVQLFNSKHLQSRVSIVKCQEKSQAFITVQVSFSPGFGLLVHITKTGGNGQLVPFQAILLSTLTGLKQDQLTILMVTVQKSTTAFLKGAGLTFPVNLRTFSFVREMLQLH